MCCQSWRGGQLRAKTVPQLSGCKTDSEKRRKQEAKEAERVQKQLKKKREAEEKERKAQERLEKRPKTIADQKAAKAVS